MKKIIAIALAACLLVALGVGLTMAYLHAQDSKTNTFTVGSVSIDLTEPGWDGPNGTGLRDSEDAYPGERLAKDPTIENTGANPCLLRVKVDIPTFKLNGVDVPYAVVEEVGTGWEQRDDYYYYNMPLEAGATAPAVFKAVRINRAVTNDQSTPENGTSYEILVTAYAIQAQGTIAKYSDYDNGINTAEEIALVTNRFNEVFGA